MRRLSGLAAICALTCYPMLTGCAGSAGVSFPDVAQQGSLGTIHGSNFGGHAPIVGANVFVLEATSPATTAAGVTGYAAKSKSLINADATIATYPVFTDVNVLSPTFGMSYVTTDSTGTFNITGDYACDAGSPVYLYAAGGSTTLATGGVNTVVSNNPAIINLAMLGICPSSGNFSTPPNALQFVFMNEVSTAALAYGMAGFATDALHIGSSSTNVTGLTNATMNVANLYDIQGGNQGTAGVGEGHIARAVTIAGNGTVPQAEMDTIGNILAACVDSGNTVAAPMSACTTLFADATSTGQTGGTKPIDTATAAINMAHNPGTANVVALYGLPTAVVPFAPNLLNAPKDFSVAITYNNVATPGGIAIDGAGNAYVATNATASYVTKLSPTGAVLATSAAAGNGFDSLAIDPAGNVWAVANGSSVVYSYTGGLGAVTGSPFGSGKLSAPTGVAIDTSGYVYVTYGGNSNSIVQKLYPTGSMTSTGVSNVGAVSASITSSCLTRLTSLALDASGYIWATINSSNNVCRVSNPGGAQSFQTGGINGPGNVAIDGNGNGWVPAGAQTNLYKYSSTGTATGYGVINNANQGGLSSPAWVAIDGGNNVWVTNTGNSYALSEFNSAGVALTGTSGYQSGSLNKPSYVAIDGSGDVWIPNQGTSTVSELIGAGVPTVTPMSALKPGVRP